LTSLSKVDRPRWIFIPSSGAISEVYSEDVPQDDMEPNTLHVLGFGLAGAILTNALVLIYFVWS